MRLFKTTVGSLAFTSACGMCLLIGPACGTGILPVDSEELAPGGAFVKPSVSAKPVCDRFTATGVTIQTVVNGPFVGLATVVIDGTTYEDVAVTTIVTEVRPLPNGILLARTSHTFDFNFADPPLAGSFTTIDRANLTPLDNIGCVYRLDGGGLIDAGQGTGVFEGSTGGMRGIGNEVNFCTGVATWAFNGSICFRGG